MKYTLHQLQVFARVVQTKSITKAAEELYLTQPAVSIQLKNFQDQFDIPLTEVVGRKLFITDFGKEVATAAEKILNEVEAINLKTMAHKNKISGRLRISIVSTGKYVMPYFLSDFMKVNPAVQLFMDVTNKTKVVESLENNEVDFSLVSVLPDHLRIDKVELMQNKLFLVGNNERKFNKRPYDNSIFEDLPLIYREPGSGTRHTMEEYIDRNKIPVHKNMELATNDAIKEAVIAGLGYSIMPLIGIRNELLNGDLQIIPVKGFPIRSTWNLIWMKNKNLSPVALALLDYIRSEKEKIIRDKFQWFEEY